MIIELFGLPGVGKTTLAGQLSVLGINTIAVDSRLEIFYFGCLGILRNLPISLGLLGRAVRTSLSPYYFWNIYMVRMAKYEKARHVAGWVILDEGLGQNFFSYAPTYQTPGEVKRIYDKLPPVDLRIIFHLDETLRQQHLSQRYQVAPEKFVDRGEQKEKSMVQVSEWLRYVGDAPGTVFVSSSEEALAIIKPYVEKHS